MVVGGGLRFALELVGCKTLCCSFIVRSTTTSSLLSGHGRITDVFV
jgi:hypothetical protein